LGTHEIFFKEARAQPRPAVGWLSKRLNSPAVGPGGAARRNQKEIGQCLEPVLIVVLILMLVGALPRWGHSRSWGYFPSGGLGLVVLVLVILALSGRL